MTQQLLKQSRAAFFTATAFIAFVLSITLCLPAWASETTKPVSETTEQASVSAVSVQTLSSLQTDLNHTPSKDTQNASPQQTPSASSADKTSKEKNTSPRESAQDKNDATSAVPNPAKKAPLQTKTKTSSLNKSASSASGEKVTQTAAEQPKTNQAQTKTAAPNTAKKQATTTSATSGTSITKRAAEQNTSSDDNPSENLNLSGWYKIAASKNTSFVLDVKGGKTTNGTNVQLYRNNHTLAQFFSFTYANGYYRIVNARAQKALDAEKGKKVNGTNIAVRSNSSAADSQLFKVTKNKNGTYTFVNKANGLAMDIAKNTLKNGSNVQTEKPDGSSGQCFRLISVTNILPRGLVTIRPIYTTRTLDVKSGKTAEKTNVQLYKSNGTLAQKWYVHALGDNTYRIQSVVSNKYLGLNGKNVVIRTGNRSHKNQQWIASIKNGGIALQNASNGLMLDIAGAKNKNGTNVQTYKDNDTKAQRFLVLSTIPLKNGMYTIATALKSSMLLDVANGSTKNKANVRIYKRNNTNAQKWNVKRNSDGTYTFINVNSKKVLDVRNGKMAKRTNVQQYAPNKTAAQKWRIVYDNGLKLVSAKNSAYVLDLSGARTKNKTNVQIYKDLDKRSQRWVFTPTTRTKSKYELMPKDQKKMYRTAQKYSSSNSWLIVVNRKTNRMGVFRGSKGHWDLTKYLKCTTGAHSTPTPLGQTKIMGRVPSFGHGYTCWYATQFRTNGYFVHSGIYQAGSKKKFIDGRLGMNLSQGCVRLSLNNAKWFYQKVPNKSKFVVIQ